MSERDIVDKNFFDCLFNHTMLMESILHRTELDKYMGFYERESSLDTPFSISLKKLFSNAETYILKVF